MFLTRVQINPRRRGAQKLIGSPHAMHAAVLAGFADPRPTDQGRVLWRLDSYDANRVLLFVASPDRPDFTHIGEQAGWPTTVTWHTLPYDPFLGSLRTGQCWQFRLTANPVHSGRKPGWADTKPIAHVTVKQQEQWLLGRVHEWGFRLVGSRGAEPDSDAIDLAITARASRRFRRNNSQVTIATATYEGQLEITNPDAMRRTLTHGVGRAKSYGCGLLTLARPQPGSP